MEAHIVARVMQEFTEQHELRLQTINAEFDEEVSGSSTVRAACPACLA